MDEQNFLSKVISPAQRACRKYGYLPSVLIAQACLETGYGVTDLFQVNNLLGMKASLLNDSWQSVWDGSIFTKITPEQYGAEMTTVKADFRQYHSIEECFTDYLLFLTYASNDGPGGAPKYGPEVLSIKDPETLITAVSSRGYATAKTYVEGVMRIINRHDLTIFDKSEESMESPLVTCRKYSPNHSGKRMYAIDRITPHCVVGQLSADSILEWLALPSTKASCNYAIGTGGEIGEGVPETCRSWCSSSAANDQRAITIECASDKSAPYAFNSKVYDSLVNLCVDICKRHYKDTLLWIPDKDKALKYEPKKNEMLLTVHRWFANKDCPGQWLMDRMQGLANAVTDRLGDPFGTGTFFRVQVGAYKNLEYALKRMDNIKELTGLVCFVEYTDLYRVYCGSFRDPGYAEERLKNLFEKGIGGAFIVAQN